MIVDKTDDFTIQLKAARVRAGGKVSSSKLRNKHRDGILVRAMQVRHAITHLRDFLNGCRKDYLGLERYLNPSELAMTEDERNAIDMEAQAFVRECQATLKELNADMQLTFKPNVVPEHHVACFESLSLYLKKVILVHTSMQGMRTQRTNTILKMQRPTHMSETGKSRFLGMIAACARNDNNDDVSDDDDDNDGGDDDDGDDNDGDDDDDDDDNNNDDDNGDDDDASTTIDGNNHSNKPNTNTGDNDTKHGVGTVNNNNNNTTTTTTTNNNNRISTTSQLRRRRNKSTPTTTTPPSSRMATPTTRPPPTTTRTTPTTPTTKATTTLLSAATPYTAWASNMLGDTSPTTSLDQNQIDLFKEEHTQRTFADAVQKAESKVMEVAKLQQELMQELNVQSQQIETIDDNTNEADLDITQGNKEVKKAMKSSNDLRWGVVFFILMCAFCLIFIELFR